MRKGYLYSMDDYDITENGEFINKHNGHVQKPQKNSKGYLRVHVDGKMQLLHRLVAEKYVPNPENKPQVNHIDGNKMNNAASNLEWVTNQENRNHAVNNGLHVYGEKCTYSKLRKNDVDFIRRHTEMSANKMSEIFHVSPSYIRSLRNNYWWKTEKICRTYTKDKYKK